MPRTAPTLAAFAVLAHLAQLAHAQIELGPTMPMRTGHALAFDAARGRTVMVGGESNSLGVLADVRVRQAGPWQRLTGGNEPAVSGHGMVFVPALPGGGSGLLLFGGVDHTDAPRDATWLFDGGNWSVTEGIVAPSPRRNPLMAFDPVRNVAVLHGGEDGNHVMLDDTWQWEPVGGWLQVQASGPRGIGMAFNPVTGRVTLVVAGAFATANIWEWIQGAWVQVASNVGDRWLSGCSVATSPLADGILLFGGSEAILGDPTNNLRLWNGSTIALLQPQGSLRPQPRRRAALALDSARARLVVHGGIGDSPLYLFAFSDTWEWNGTSWSAPPGASEPPFRDEAGLVQATNRGTLLLHGGAPLWPFSPTLDDTWERIGGAWYPRGSGPRFRGLAICYDPVRDRVVLFDGTATHEHDGTAWQQIATPVQPPATARNPMAFHVAAGQCLLCNGQTWTWNGANWIQLQPLTPAPAMSALAYDSLRAQLVGLSIAGFPPIASTWTWNGVDWTQSPGPTVPAGINPTSVRMSYDGNRDRTVAVWTTHFGGAEPIDVWEWNGSSWSSLGTTAARLQGGKTGPLPAMAYEPASQHTILFSGAETWFLTSPDPASAVSFGQGCAGLRGIPTLNLVGPAPWLGSTYSLDVVSGPGTTPVFCMLGTNAITWMNQPLPMSLSGYGMSGCLLYLDVLDTQYLASGRYSIPIPNLPELVGLAFYNQALVRDPGSNVAGGVSTNAIRSVIGRR